jgi:hypothetical protein
MPSVKETLVAARAVIEDPARWNKNGLYAADERGESAPVGSERAVCFCIFGAIAKAEGMHEGFQYSSAPGAYVKQAVRDVSELEVTEYNDARSTTHADVLAVFDRAIEAAQ